MSKITVKAPANIAFIKYWGRENHQLYIPRNNSISMTMSGCYTTTTIELIDGEADIVEVKFYEQPPKVLTPDNIKAIALFKQIERIRIEAGSNQRVKIFSENNFPADAGIASSASGFTALTGSLLLAYGMKEKFDDKIEFSRQIRLCGSGSAIRSAFGGFVEFLKGTDHESSHAVQIADENHWDLVDIVAIVDPEKKLVSSSKGHLMADSSPYFETRISEMQDRINQTRQAILDRDFETLGRCIEEDSTSLHSVMMTSVPPIFYWGPGSMKIMLEIMRWRREDGLQAYFTLDAGPNVHIICQKKDADEVNRRLKEIEFVKWTIYNEVCAGAEIVNLD